MRHSILLSTAVLAGSLGIGCGDQSGVTNPDPGGVNPSDGTLSYKTEIQRFEDFLVIFHGQADPPLFAAIGVGLEEFPAVCAGTAPPEELADYLIITHPSKQGGTSAHVQIKDKELSALVWQVDVGEPGVDICQLEPLAVGTVNVTVNDNEGEFFETAPGANAFLLRFVGIVTDQETGQRYHLQGAVQIVVLPDGTFTSRPVPFLSLRPVGG
jgi:hypothetical protein